MAYAANPNGLTWDRCEADLAHTFEKWRAKSWRIDCKAGEPFGMRSPNRWAPVHSLKPEVRRVTVTFAHPSRGEVVVAVDRFGYPVDNLWCIARGLDGIRLNELRGLDDVERQFYQALPAPAPQKPKRDPWAVLELAPNASPDAIAAMFRAKASKLHPDKGGSKEAFQELQEAYDAVRGIAS